MVALTVKKNVAGVESDVIGSFLSLLRPSARWTKESSVDVKREKKVDVIGGCLLAD